MTQIIGNLVATVVLVVLIFCVWHYNVDWLGFVKSKLPAIPIVKKAPLATSQWTTTGLEYSPGLDIEGLEWRQNYSEHHLTIRNDNSDELRDLRVTLHLPAGIVKHSVASRYGCTEPVFSQFKKPIGIGQRGGPITKIEKSLSNSTDITISKMENKSMVTLTFVLDYRGREEGGWLVDLSFELGAGNNTERHRDIHPLAIKSTRPLTLEIDTSTSLVGHDNVTGTVDTYPFTPLVSKPDGTFLQVDDFDGNIEALKAATDGVLLLDFGFDYTLDTSP
jgi:hypothetical protein